MRLGSLFSGIGGFDLAGQRAGLTVAWQSEIDPYASAVLKKHWPTIPNHGDIRAMRGGDVEPVDIVTAGFPCQPVSLAGKQLGDADERWMWPETIRIIREVRPQWVLLENVRGLLSADAGRLFGIVLRDLAESGFDVEWDCISASAVGAPHLRDRVWIVAHNPFNGRGERWQGRPNTSCTRKREQPLQTMAHATSARCEEGRSETSRTLRGETRGTQPERRSDAMADTASMLRPSIFWHESNGLLRTHDTGGAHWWSVEPELGRVAHGIPRRVDRLRGLGNAIVPQVAEFIFQRILDYERSAS